MNHGALQSPDYVSGVIHHTWTVPQQTKDNTILLGLRDVMLWNGTSLNDLQ